MSNEKSIDDGGATLWDVYFGQVCGGLAPLMGSTDGAWNVNDITTYGALLADAMIAERNKRK